MTWERGETMRHGVWKGIFTFVLVLALTVGTVAALSTATAAKAETAPARYSQKVREAQSSAAATELSAPVNEESNSPLVSMGIFVLVLAVTGFGCAAYLRSRRKEQERKTKERTTEVSAVERRRAERKARRQYERRAQRRPVYGIAATPSIRRI